jgi:hypothetical protein
MCRKNRQMREIRIIPVKINEHNPKAQSVCYPEESVDYNEFYTNLYKQLKNYDPQGSNQTKTMLRVREENSRNRRKR